MNDVVFQARQKAIDAALGSVRAEGLVPSDSLQKSLASYLQGDAELTTIREETVLRVSNVTPSVN